MPHSNSCVFVFLVQGTAVQKLVSLLLSLTKNYLRSVCRVVGLVEFFHF